MPNYYRPKPSPRCPNCGKVYMAAPQLAHHAANAARLCKPEPVCANCGQWQHAGGDCLNECAKRGFAPRSLNYHVTGAIMRGEAEPIIEQRA